MMWDNELTYASVSAFALFLKCIDLTIFNDEWKSKLALLP